MKITVWMEVKYGDMGNVMRACANYFFMSDVSFDRYWEDDWIIVQWDWHETAMVDPLIEQIEKVGVQRWHYVSVDPSCTLSGYSNGVSSATTSLKWSEKDDGDVAALIGLIDRARMFGFYA